MYSKLGPMPLSIKSLERLIIMRFRVVSKLMNLQIFNAGFCAAKKLVCKIGS